MWHSPTTRTSFGCRNGPREGRTDACLRSAFRLLISAFRPTNPLVGTSKKMELKLVGVARASLEELLGDYQDFLRQRGLVEWGKNHPMAGVVRRLAYAKDRSYETYSTFIENAPPE